MKNVFGFDPFGAHFLEAISRNLIKNVMCDSCDTNFLYLERGPSKSGSSHKKEILLSRSFPIPFPTQYLHNTFQFSKRFHIHYLIWEAMWCSRKKIRLESGNLNCSLVPSPGGWWPWTRYLTCLGRNLLICNLPVLEQMTSKDLSVLTLYNFMM